MKKYLVLIICFASMLLVGCGHNVATQSKGWGIDISWSSDSYVPNMRLGYWDITYLMVRENTQVTASSNADISAAAGSGGGDLQTANADGSNGKKSPQLSSTGGGRVGNKITMKTGQQINGYMVDLTKASPETAAEIVKAIKSTDNKSSKFYLIQNNQLVEITQSEFNKRKNGVLKIDGNTQQVIIK